MPPRQEPAITGGQFIRTHSLRPFLKDCFWRRSPETLAVFLPMAYLRRSRTSTVLCLEIRLEVEKVVYRMPEILFAAEIALGS